MQETRGNKPLIIYKDDGGEEKKTYSEYEIKDGVISFITNQNKITLPISRLIKIKEEKKDG
jgi:hypothetical protein